MTLRYTAAEQMVICGARQIKDGDVIYAGVGLPTLTTWLAKYSHAPNSWAIAEQGIIRGTASPLGFGTDSLPVQTRAEVLTGFYGVNALALHGYVNKGFLGTGQVDRYGNVNSTCAGDYRNPVHRWPGSGGGNDVISMCPDVILILSQSRRRFPEKVDFITSPGYLDGTPGKREKIGLLPGTGPKVVITDMGVYGFENGEMVLKSYHAGLGIAIDDIRRETGWDLKIAADVAETEPPTDEELRVFREKLDPTGMYRGRLEA
jgi:glutaconate CoA-transferase, subunit B